MARVSRLSLSCIAALLASAGPALAGPQTVPAPSSSPSRVLATMGREGPASPPPPRGPLEPAQDRTLAPYLAVAGSDSETERVPLEHTSADVAIVGVIARVQVSQRYVNRGKKPIEAIYVFPASTRAAVHGMRMKIGGRTIEARIDRRQAARATYEAARQDGRRTSLLEQERPNVFTMNVANVMPGDQISVELEYSELLVPEEGVYEFVYPTVVGPRYGGGADPRRDRWIANPYLPEGSAPVTTFALSARVESAIDLKELSSPSHQVNVAYEGKQRARVSLDNGAAAGNRDFVLRYRLAGDQIETGVLLYEGAGSGGRTERYFAVMLEPPPRPAPEQVPPREFIFLLDVSGSMHGFPLDTAKVLMRKLLGNLRSIDRFNVVLFSGAASTLSQDGSLPATAENISRAMSVIDRQQGGGGTELLGGLQACYRIPRPGSGPVSRTVVVVTDGFVGVEAQTFRLVRERLGEANLFAFGIGSSVNRGLIEGMARAGQGEPFVVLDAQKAAGAAERLRTMIEQPVLTGVEVRFNGFAAEEVAPAKLPDLLARRPLVLLGRYQGPASGRIEVSGWSGRGAARFHRTLQVKGTDVRAENAPLRWLWARKWVDILDDERHMGAGAGAEQAITELGLGHRLLTAFTSFVAVDSEKVNAGGQAESVKQPLPLPEGVSNHAVGSGFVGGLALQGARASASAPGAARKRSLSDDPLAGLAAAPMMAAAPRQEAEDSVESGTEGAAAPPPRRRVPAKEKDEQRAGAVSWLEVRALSLRGTSEAEPLVVAVKAALAVVGPGGVSCGLPAGVDVRLRLTVDRQGKVVRVEEVSATGKGSPRVGVGRPLACLVQRLVGLVSSTRASTGGSGTVELRLRASQASLGR